MISQVTRLVERTDFLIKLRKFILFCKFPYRIVVTRNSTPFLFHLIFNSAPCSRSILPRPYSVCLFIHSALHLFGAIKTFCQKFVQKCREILSHVLHFKNPNHNRKVLPLLTQRNHTRHTQKTSCTTFRSSQTWIYTWLSVCVIRQREKCTLLINENQKYFQAVC